LDWPETVDMVIDGIAQGGEGVGRWEERVVFAGGGLPGEHVRVVLRERRVNYARGDVVNILDPSPDRIAPRDPQAGHMPWQHIAYDAQLRYKRQILAEQLAKIAGLHDISVEPTLVVSAPWGYRTTARLHSDGLIVGYHVAASNAIQPATVDPLLYPALNHALAALPGALAIEPVRELFEVLLRVSETDGYTLAALDGREDLRLTAARWRARCQGLAGVLVGPQLSIAMGAERLTEDLGGITFLLRPTTFFQVNLAAAKALLDLVQDGLALQGTERLLDLFCGAGAFALPLAARAASVIGVEAGGGAVEDAIMAASLNGITNVEFWAGHVEQALAEVEDRVDAVVLDPPRRGCHPSALDELLRLRPRRIVYVSCQPATLARDLRVLIAGGYRVLRVTPVDLFPQTPHIESVTVLEYRG
jgi:23S rRNA (uracil1939-C5)-methyltransferase